jgi:hypothetical protein
MGMVGPRQLIKNTSNSTKTNAKVLISPKTTPAVPKLATGCRLWMVVNKHLA